MCDLHCNYQDCWIYSRDLVCVTQAHYVNVFPHLIAVYGSALYDSALYGRCAVYNSATVCGSTSAVCGSAVW